MSLRRKIYEVIEVADKDDRDSLIYDRFMLVCIAASIVPLCFKETNSLFVWLDRATVTVFIAVSYTHLDVYKRQPSDSSRVNGKTLARSEQRKLTPMQPSTMRFCLPTGMMMARNMPNSITEQPQRCIRDREFSTLVCAGQPAAGPTNGSLAYR